MKIALCLEYPIRQAGGTEVLVRELIDGLARHHELVLVSDDESAITNDSNFAAKIQTHLRWNPLAVSRDTALKLADEITRVGVDLAHFHFGGNYSWGCRWPNTCPALHVKRSGIPTLITNHGVFGVLDGYIGPQRNIGTKLALLPFAWASRLQLIAAIDAEVAVSRHDYHALRRRYWPLQGKFRQIYHSRIHENEFSRPEPPARAPTILCAGTIGLRKGQTFLVEAFRRLADDFPEWNLLFIGRPGDAETVEAVQRAAEFPQVGGRITWISSCSDDELRHWMQSVEIFAMPSMHEGLGLSLQEALYCGCACIASRIGGIPDLIQDGDNGILVERANVEALATGLARLMRDEPMRTHFRSRGPASVVEKQMTAERMVINYLNLYREIL
jgi:glycosyltransferase involved in cell wall biosynthesis